MRGAEGVVLAFVTARKAAQPAQLAQGVHTLATTGKNFVRIGLVSNIPDDAVLRRVEHVVQRHGQLYRAQVGAEMATCLRHAFQHKAAQLVGQRLQLRARQLAQVIGAVNAI